MDLGLLFTHDCRHFREPVPDFPIVAGAETGWYTLPEGDATVHFPALIQGQGFENIGEQTLFWYAPWPEGDADGIRLAAWPRDRLNSLSPFKGPGNNSYVISQPFSLDGKPAGGFSM